MKVLADALAIIRQNRKMYLIVNGSYYGLVIAALIYGQFNRAIHDELLKGAGSAFGSGGPLAPVLDAYLAGRVPQAVALTFVINLLLGAFAEITLPSLILPFSGLLIGWFRAALWGVLFSPDPGVALTGQNILYGVFVTILLFLEGQGYVLGMFGVVLQGRAFLWPKTVAEETRWRGYVAGLKLTSKLYLLVAIVLLIAALYEVLIVVIMPR